MPVTRSMSRLNSGSKDNSDGTAINKCTMARRTKTRVSIGSSSDIIDRRASPMADAKSLLEESDYCKVDESKEHSSQPGTTGSSLIVKSSYVTNDIMVSVPVYQLREDEKFEDAAQIVFDEFDLHSDTDDVDLTSSLPIRVFTDFTFYDWNTKQLLPLLIEGRVYGASGLSRPELQAQVTSDVSEDHDSVNEACDGEDEDWMSLSIRKIIDIWSDPDLLDPQIWVRTAYAWYKLETPSKAYRAFFEPLIIPNLFTSSVIAVRNDPDITFREFMEFINFTACQTDPSSLAVKLLGRTLTKQDFYSVQDTVKSRLLAVRVARPGYIKSSPLLSLILGTTVHEDDNNDYTSTSSLSDSDQSDSDLVNRRTNLQRIKEPVIITPIVSTIANRLFYQTMVVTGQDTHAFNESRKPYIDICNAKSSFTTYMKDPSMIRWGKAVPGRTDHFQSIFLDEVEYCIGDIVAVAPGRDADKLNAANSICSSAQTANMLGNNLWFCRIQYFYEDYADGKRQQLFHGRWFEHGAKTVLAETSNPLALYLLNRCDTNPVAVIVRKIQVRRLSLSDPEPIWTAEQEKDSSDFYFSHIWDHVEWAFVDPNKEHSDFISQYCEPHRSCYSCALLERSYSLEKMQTAVRVAGKSYHLHDFVYFRTSRSLLNIGQVSNLLLGNNDTKIEVQLFSRHESPEYTTTLYKKTKIWRVVRPTSKYSVISANALDGHCEVENVESASNLDAYTEGEGAKFYLEPESAYTIRHCGICIVNKRNRAKKEAVIKSKHILRALDLFSGAGGLSTGMGLSGFVKTHWAVDISSSAAMTFKANHPDAIVYNQDSNILLKHTSECFDGQNNEPLRALGSDGEILPPMPTPGEVDIIMGGPPCQSFSGLNIFKRADDIRHTLISNMISYVEFYRPLYFLLENVPGLLQCRLRGSQVGWKIMGGIEGGMVKFIMRALTSLGYQVQVKLLNAAHYGSPQDRTRVIIWAAQFGLPMPYYPIPTHILLKSNVGVPRKVSTIGQIPFARRRENDEINFAPFREVTVKNAIGDLPAFNWSNPCGPLPEDGTSYRKMCPTFLAHHNDTASQNVVGFNCPCKYVQEPSHPYQEWMRKNSSRVIDHVTPTFVTDIVERVVNIPMKPNANYADLPSAQRNGRMGRFEKGTYGRLDENGHFKTIRTTVYPTKKSAKVLHPTQKRVLTVREYARAQGFHDSYEFLSMETSPRRIVNDQYRQIGNAVPVPLAIALGKALGDTLIRHWIGEVASDSSEEGSDCHIHDDDEISL